MFNGIITPIVTPFNDDETQTINYQATDQLIDHLIKNGVNGIFPLGSNGEFNVLTIKERNEFVSHVINYVNHRVPVYVGTGACSTNEAVYLSRKAEELGADALSVITPYFFKLRDEDIYDYYKQIAESVKIPIILYNIPGNTQNNINPKVLDQLAEIPNVAGIKDSSGNTESINAYLKVVQKHKNLHFLIGSDSKISYAFERGATGAIAGTSNLLVKNVVALNNALRSGDTVTAEKMQESLNPLREIMHEAPVPSVLKRAVTLAGIANVGNARKPEVAPNETLNQKIKELIVEYNLK